MAWIPPKTWNGSAPATRSEQFVIRVLFVCLGNICRSPTAHAVFERLVDAEGLAQQIQVDSAGTGAWHVGDAPDGRAVSAAEARGYRMKHLRARQVEASDLQTFDFVLAMDRTNLANLRRECPAGFQDRLHLFLAFGDCDVDELPDPYYGGDAGFERVLDLVESAVDGFLDAIERAHAGGA